MLRDDADMGDWNENTSVWSSANGFKQSRRPVSNFTPNNLSLFLCVIILIIIFLFCAWYTYFSAPHI